jgi:hypothetical protein
VCIIDYIRFLDYHIWFSLKNYKTLWLFCSYYKSRGYRDIGEIIIHDKKPMQESNIDIYSSEKILGHGLPGWIKEYVCNRVREV